ncbi:MAG: hypothetical protein LBJ23_00370 [Tannerella sp.]|nr:hypothetical protein [Tannerella sp.]
MNIQVGYGQFEYRSFNVSLGENGQIIYAPPDDLSLANFRNDYFRIAFNPTFNYKVYDGWYAGIGIEPTYYMVLQSGETAFSKFDIPLTARVGYDFKYMDVSFNYTHGLCDIMNPDYYSSGKIRRWQIQLFIPF